MIYKDIKERLKMNFTMWLAATQVSYIMAATCFFDRVFWLGAILLVLWLISYIKCYGWFLKVLEG